MKRNSNLFSQLPVEVLANLAGWISTSRDVVRWGQSCQYLNDCILLLEPRRRRSTSTNTNTSTSTNMAWMERFQQHHKEDPYHFASFVVGGADGGAGAGAGAGATLSAPLPPPTCWESMAWYEAMKEAGLLQENRIGFFIASTEIDGTREGDDTDEEEGSHDSIDGELLDDDDDDEEVEEEDDRDGSGTFIRGSLKRIESIQRVVQQFPNVRIVVDAHCGTMAPASVAQRFSQVRGMVVADELARYGSLRGNRRRTTDNDDDDDGDDGDDDDGDDDDFVTLHAWGRRVANVASGSRHRYADLARKGMGWVEIYLVLGGVELPQRPDYFQGFSCHGS